MHVDGESTGFPVRKKRKEKKPKNMLTHALTKKKEDDLVKRKSLVERREKLIFFAERVERGTKGASGKKKTGKKKFPPAEGGSFAQKASKNRARSPSRRGAWRPLKKGEKKKKKKIYRNPSPAGLRGKKKKVNKKTEGPPHGDSEQTSAGRKKTTKGKDKTF